MLSFILMIVTSFVAVAAVVAVVHSTLNHGRHGQRVSTPMSMMMILVSLVVVAAVAAVVHFTSKD